MGGSGFVGGLVQGMEQAQDRDMKMAHLKLQQDFSKHQQKLMETEDQIKGLQLQSFQKRLKAEAMLPSLRSDLMRPRRPSVGGPRAMTMGMGEMEVPESEPEIDRMKLVSFLTAAEQAGQDPDQLMQLMEVEDPRIGKIRRSIKGEKFIKLGADETLYNPETGEPVAYGKQKLDKPVSMAPGGTLVNPATGEVMYTAPPVPAKPVDYGDRLESLAASYSANTWGTPLTFSELLKKDPIEAKKLRDVAMVEEPATIAAGKQAATIEGDKAKTLTPTEANTMGVPYGTTKGQAEGVMPMTAQQRATIASFDTARVIIADITQYSEKVNTASAGLQGRAQQGMKLWGAWTQSNPDAALLQSKAGELATIARSMGEKGALADKDVARAAALIPSVLDTREIAQKKLIDMGKIIDQGEVSFRKSLGIDARAPGGSKAPPIKTPPPDPLAHIQVPRGLTPKQEDVYRRAYADQHGKVQTEMQKKK